MSHKLNSGTWKKGHTPWNKGTKKTLNIPSHIKQNIVNDYLNGMLRKDIEIKYNYKPWLIYEILREAHVMKKMHDVKIGHITTEETKKKISLKNKGHQVSEKTRKAVSDANKRRTFEQLKIQVSKSWLTKKANHTENTSKPEEEFYKKLLKENTNKTIYRNYKDKERYPFYCDFYIKEDDLFIELNLHWTHGRHPFNEFDPKDQKLLNEWKEKAKTSKFYQQAIYVWTDLDPRKQKTARDNNLNYKTIY